jgi:epoxyqueuosine reductase
MIPSAQIKAEAMALGFSRVGLAPARPTPHLEAYLKWVAAGRQGEMHYMARPDRLARRRDLQVILPGARTLVMVAADYGPAAPEPTAGEGRVAAYALGMDYHAALLGRLEALADWMRRQSPGSVRYRAFVDTGAVLERGHGQQAGLGFIGKNTMLIHPRRGSDFFLGEIVTDAEVEAYDQPGRETQCGTCTRCLGACPTRAFVEPYVLDARRCISYLTIEHPGWIDRQLRPQMGQCAPSPSPSGRCQPAHPRPRCVGAGAGGGQGGRALAGRAARP